MHRHPAATRSPCLPQAHPTAPRRLPIIRHPSPATHRPSPVTWCRRWSWCPSRPWQTPRSRPPASTACTRTCPPRNPTPSGRASIGRGGALIIDTTRPHAGSRLRVTPCCCLRTASPRRGPQPRLRSPASSCLYCLEFSSNSARARESKHCTWRRILFAREQYPETSEHLCA
jgi:hypothetical protein